MQGDLTGAASWLGKIGFIQPLFAGSDLVEHSGAARDVCQQRGSWRVERRLDLHTR